jgi:outer membrane lipoprotein-sorting protein
MISRLRVMLVCWAALLAVTARAQIGPEIARQHAQRAGDGLAALQALRAEGRILLGAETISVVAIAQRPGRLRVETTTPSRHVVQVTDGVNPPWISHPDTHGGAPQDMPDADARDFAVSADFDGVLVDYAAKGYSVDYAGEETLGGKRAAKLLMMGPRDEVFFLWVDVASHEIVKRLLYRTRGGKRMSIETVYKDFRPVGGVPQPYRIETLTDGQVVYVMLMDRMEANPVIAPGTFARP